MKADPARQRRLLDLQAVDPRLRQIAHRRTNLPEGVEHDRLRAQLDELGAALVSARTAHDDVQHQVAKAEADVQLVRDRAARNQARLEAGQGTPKDLQALQHELTSLARRQTALEDLQLEVMERAEGLDGRVTELHGHHGELEARVAVAAATRHAATAELDAEAAEIEASRAGVVAEVGADLHQLYEQIRTQTGIGAAALTRRRCAGCNLELLGTDLRRVAEADEQEVVRCEECRRILVRTPEAGL